MKSVNWISSLIFMARVALPLIKAHYKPTASPNHSSTVNIPMTSVVTVQVLYSIKLRSIINKKNNLRVGRININISRPYNSIKYKTAIECESVLSVVVQFRHVKF